MRRGRLIPLCVIAAAVTLMTSSCGSATESSPAIGPATQSNSGSAVGEHVPAAKIATSPDVVVYDTPGDGPRDDHSIYQVDVTTGEVRGLGSGVAVQDVAQGTTGVLTWRSETSSVIHMLQASDDPKPFELDASSEPSVALLDQGQILVQQENAGDVLIIQNGEVIDRTTLADIELTMPQENRKGPYQGDSSRGDAVGYALNDEGQLLVVDVAERGAAIQNLETGEAVSVPADFAHVRDAAVGADGSLYLLGYAGETSSEPELFLLKFDLNSLKLEQTLDTGVTLTDDVLGTALTAVPGQSVVLSVVDGATGPVATSLYAVSGSQVERVPNVPSDSGIMVEAAGDGSVYLFGGPAGNQAYLVELTKGGRVPVFTGEVPKGSYIDAIEMSAGN